MSTLDHARTNDLIACAIGVSTSTLPFDAIWAMCNELSWIGFCWFTVGEGQDMAAMVEAGTLDLSPYEHARYELKT